MGDKKSDKGTEKEIPFEKSRGREPRGEPPTPPPKTPPPKQE